MPTFNPSSGSPRKMSPSQEQYIEAIADLLTRDKVCSVSDIAAQVQVSRPAVSRAVRELSEQNLVTHKAYGYVDLTERGQQIADKLTERHEALHRFLKDVLGYDEDWADQEACRLEHQVDDAFVERLDVLCDFVSEHEEMKVSLRARYEDSGN
jgi:DtxR family Mn-dependent transcriptional regulator